MTSTSITIEFNPDALNTYTDEHLAMLWHLVQANPVDGFEHSQPGDLAMKVGWEIIRRWLKDIQPEMYRHQQSHYYRHQLARFARYKPGDPDFHDGHYEPRAIPDTEEMWEALEAKLAEMGEWAGAMDRLRWPKSCAELCCPSSPTMTTRSTTIRPVSWRPDRVPATEVVTATRRWGGGDLDVAVYYCSAELWDAGSHRGRRYFELAKADESVLEWL